MIRGDGHLRAVSRKRGHFVSGRRAPALADFDQRDGDQRSVL